MTILDDSLRHFSSLPVRLLNGNWTDRAKKLVFLAQRSFLIRARIIYSLSQTKQAKNQHCLSSSRRTLQLLVLYVFSLVHSQLTAPKAFVLRLSCTHHRTMPTMGTMTTTYQEAGVGQVLSTNKTSPYKMR